MSWRYFGADLALNIFTGILVGSIAVLAIGPSWNGHLAMLVGMFGGMVVALPVARYAGRWLGAFEVMLPSMLTGMTAGMFVAMRAAAEGFDLAGGAALGAVCGVGSLLYSVALNLYLRGVVLK